MANKNNKRQLARKAYLHLTTKQPAKKQRGPAWLTPSLIKKVTKERVLASTEQPPEDGCDSDDSCAENCDCGDTRIIQITGSIEYEMVDYVAQKLLEFSDSPDEPILILITSPGGLIDCGLAIYDYLMTSNMPIITANYGTASSAAAIIMLAGEERMVSPNSTVMIHDASCEYEGQIDKNSLDIMRRDFTAIQGRLERLMAKRTKNTTKQIREWCRIEKRFSARQAVKAGFATRLIQA